MKLNQEAFNHAKSLITAAKVVRKSDWNEAEPTRKKQMDFLNESDLQTYGKWFLVIDDEADEASKERYSFPYGDFDKVHRSALLAAKHHAADEQDRELENAVDHLLIQIDKKPDVVSEASDESFPASDPPNWRERR